MGNVIGSQKTYGAVSTPGGNGGVPFTWGEELKGQAKTWQRQSINDSGGQKEGVGR